VTVTVFEEARRDGLIAVGYENGTGGNLAVRPEDALRILRILAERDAERREAARARNLDPEPPHLFDAREAYRSVLRALSENLNEAWREDHDGLMDAINSLIERAGRERSSDPIPA
jgi:hypothetical protein